MGQEGKASKVEYGLGSGHADQGGGVAGLADEIAQQDLGSVADLASAFQGRKSLLGELAYRAAE
ncbi:MAG TPA: hypothetical protein VFW62_03485 [bacterium]|nr:hypothetical protein [bacterium]